MDDSTGLYDPEEWPGGLVCPFCGHVFEPGEAYSSRPVLPLIDDVDTVVIVCPGCAVESSLRG